MTVTRTYTPRRLPHYDSPLTDRAALVADRHLLHTTTCGCAQGATR